MRKLSSTLVLTLVVFSSSNVAVSQPSVANCQLPNWFQAVDLEKTYATGQDIIYQRQILGNQNALVFSEKMKVNADANLRAYSATDLTGSKCSNLPISADPLTNGCSMGHIANGVSATRSVNGKTVALSDRAVVETFRDARAAGWPADFPVKFNFFALNTRLGEPRRQIKRIPCETPEGFLTSQAATPSGLRAQQFMGLPSSCDSRIYLDAAIPSVVVPICWRKAYRAKNPKRCPAKLGLPETLDVLPGALAVVRDGTGRAHYTLVGDLGPARKLGEVSVGLAAAASDGVLPRTYNNLKNLSDRRMDVVIFPNEVFQGTLTSDQLVQMQARSKSVFANWQGSVENSTLVLAKCARRAQSQ